MNDLATQLHYDQRQATKKTKSKLTVMQKVLSLNDKFHTKMVNFWSAHKNQFMYMYHQVLTGGSEHMHTGNELIWFRISYTNYYTQRDTDVHTYITSITCLWI